MKKFTFVLVIMLAYGGFTKAQTMIENYETITMNLFSQGTMGSLAIVANPDSSVANPSPYVCKMVIGGTGRDPWAGWYAPATVNVTENKYIHVKVWKTRISRVAFKLENGTSANTGDVFPMGDTVNSTVNQWEELVFDYSAFTGTYEQIVFIPDFERPKVTVTEPQTVYFDDIYLNNDPTVGSAPVQMIEDFSTIEMNIMLNGAEDLSTLTPFVANPYPTGINLSNNVCALFRDKDGVPWDGFWGHVYPPVDVTNNHYVHVKVWKTRISPVFFKLEGGPNGTSERESMYPQTKTNEWEDMVWDYTDFSGAYPIIAFMPDKAEPVGLTEDITMYFDDIRVNNSPVSFTPTEQMISVDMNGADPALTANDTVFITGSFGGIYGTWVTPGDSLNQMMTDPDGDGIYTITLHLPDGGIAFKFAKNSGWTNEDPYGVNRTLTVAGSMYVVYTWSVGGVEVSTRKNPLAGKILMYPNPVRNDLTILTTSDVRKVIITNTLGKVVGNYNYTSNQTLNTRNLNSGMYFVTFISRDGSKVTQKLIKD
jgi:hypothetical protein